MRFLALSMSWLVIFWVLIHGVLMCFSPSRFYAFWRWYSSSQGRMVSEVPSGLHIRLRIVGFMLILTSVFFAYQLAETIIKITS
jgi:hypothetical protein